MPPSCGGRWSRRRSSAGILPGHSRAHAPAPVPATVPSPAPATAPRPAFRFARSVLYITAHGLWDAPQQPPQKLQILAIRAAVN
jgi:hypothetical protein